MTSKKRKNNFQSVEHINKKPKLYHINDYSNIDNVIINSWLILCPDIISNIYERITSVNMTKRITISNEIKQIILHRQQYRCNNKLTSNQHFNNNSNISNYICPRWIIYDGCFDESGYEIDHIKEFSIGGTNDINNLQALCPSCHSVKTKRFVKDGNCRLSSAELELGFRLSYNDNFCTLYHISNIYHMIYIYNSYK